MTALQVQFVKPISAERALAPVPRLRRGAAKGNGTVPRLAGGNPARLPQLAPLAVSNRAQATVATRAVGVDSVGCPIETPHHWSMWYFKPLAPDDVH